MSALSASSPSKLQRNRRSTSPTPSTISKQDAPLPKRHRSLPPTPSPSASNSSFEELFNPLKLLPSNSITSNSNDSTSYTLAPSQPDSSKSRNLDISTISGDQAMSLNFYGSSNETTSTHTLDTCHNTNLTDDSEETVKVYNQDSHATSLASESSCINRIVPDTLDFITNHLEDSSPVDNDAQIFDPLLLYYPRDQNPLLFQFPTRPSQLKEVLTQNRYIPSYMLDSSSTRIVNYYKKLKKYYSRSNRTLPFHPSRLSSVIYSSANPTTNFRNGYCPKSISRIEIIRYVQSFPPKQGPKAIEAVSAFLPIIRPPNSTESDQKAAMEDFRVVLNTVAECDDEKRIYLKKILNF